MPQQTFPDLVVVSDIAASASANAMDRAIARGDSAGARRHGEAAIQHTQLASLVAPTTREGVLIRLRDAATVVSDDMSPGGRKIFTALQRARRAVQRETLTGEHLACLRRLLPEAERSGGPCSLGYEICPELPFWIESAITWLARPRIVQTM
jgi:hypothetical protein